MKINLNLIKEHKAQLENHPLLVANYIQSCDDLKVFMENHVYAVWDFMCLLKTLQHNVVPSGNLWLPGRGNRSDIARLINEIVLCEESDIDPGNTGSISHFDLYIQSMLEVGADIIPVQEFLLKLTNGHHPVTAGATPAATKFMENTFKMIQQGPHCVAASFAYGRETVIPAMFERILNQIQYTRVSAPKFHYYLDRHIEVDGNEHGPMSEQLVNYFCQDDPVLIHEAEQAAISSIKARIQFFNDIKKLLN